MKACPNVHRNGCPQVAIAGVLLAVAVSGCGGVTTKNQTNSLGTITTVAGNGATGCSGNGGPATSAQLNQPICAVLDSAGNLYIGDQITNTIRKVAAGTGIISAYAGNGIPISGNITMTYSAYSGDGGLATSAPLYAPTACALDSSGNLYVADEADNVIRKINASTGIITTVAGNGFGFRTSGGGFRGDGGLATQAEMNHPDGVAVDSAGDIFISDTSNQRVREVNGSTGIITTIAGNGKNGVYSSGGPATGALVSSPFGLALDGSGNLYIAESSVVAKLNLATGMISTVAGDSTQSNENLKDIGDGGPATQASFGNAVGVALDASGNIFIADSGNNRVRKITVSTGIITTVAGTTQGYSGDGGPAAAAQLHAPTGLFFDASGDQYIADTYNSAVRKVTP
jgi:trimeric autotransporter adhesin